MHQRSWYLAVALSGILGFAGCAALNDMFSAPKPAVAPKMKESYIHHKVQFPGETIGLIATWYTGSADNWKAIVNHNPGLNPRIIKRGMVILIPGWLAKTDQPMPASFLVDRQRKVPPIMEGKDPNQASGSNGSKVKDAGATPAPSSETPANREIVIEVQPSPTDTPANWVTMGFKYSVETPKADNTAAAPRTLHRQGPQQDPVDEVPPNTESQKVALPTPEPLEPLPTPTPDFRSDERKKLLQELLNEVGK